MHLHAPCHAGGNNTIIIGSVLVVSVRKYQPQDERHSLCNTIGNLLITYFAVPSYDVSCTVIVTLSLSLTFQGCLGTGLQALRLSKDIVSGRYRYLYLYSVIYLIKKKYFRIYSNPRVDTPDGREPRGEQHAGEHEIPLLTIFWTYDYEIRY